MTLKPALFAAISAIIATTPLTTAAQEAYAPQTVPVALDPADPSNRTLGELSYRGGLVIEPGEAEIGGISGLEWWDGQLYAVTDDGRWLIMATDEIRDQLIDLVE